jgi:hypothetical protein
MACAYHAPSHPISAPRREAGRGRGRRSPAHSLAAQKRLRPRRAEIMFQESDKEADGRPFKNYSARSTKKFPSSSTRTSCLSAICSCVSPKQTRSLTALWGFFQLCIVRSCLKTILMMVTYQGRRAKLCAPYLRGKIVAALHQTRLITKDMSFWGKICAKTICKTNQSVDSSN